MRKKTSAGILMSIIVVVIVATILVTLKETPQEIATIPYQFAVKDNVGINLDTDKLHFGGAIPNITLVRSMNISTSFDARVHILSKGPGLVSVDLNDFFLNASQSQELVFSLLVPENLPLGIYEGLVIVEFYKK